MQRQPGCSTLSVVQASCLSRSSVMEEPVMPKSAPFQSNPTAAAADAAFEYVQTNLVSDIPGLVELGLVEAFDPHLVNPWGVSFRTGSPFWVSNQGDNSTTLYAVIGSTDVVNNPPTTPLPVFTVNIPTTAGGPPQGPTGQVSNTNDSFHLIDPVSGLDHGAASFIFANLNGTISGWNGSLETNGSTALVEVTTPGAVYTGLAVNEAHTMLYAADTRGGTIDVFDSNFKAVDL